MVAMMNIQTDTHSALESLINYFGSQTKLAKKLGHKDPKQVSSWFTEHSQISVRNAIFIEKITEGRFPAEWFRPDLKECLENFRKDPRCISERQPILKLQIPCNQIHFYSQLNFAANLKSQYWPDFLKEHFQADHPILVDEDLYVIDGLQRLLAYKACCVEVIYTKIVHCAAALGKGLKSEDLSKLDCIDRVSICNALTGKSKCQSAVIRELSQTFSLIDAIKMLGLGSRSHFYRLNDVILNADHDLHDQLRKNQISVYAAEQLLKSHRRSTLH